MTHEGETMGAPSGAPAERHGIARVKHEIRWRSLVVSATAMVSPQMKRVTFSSPQLADFESPSPDDHVKMRFPPETPGAEPVARDFTPRSFDRAAQTLVIDFVLHAHGPAATWARRASVGDTLEAGGPKGSTIVPDDFAWYLLIGDESALPAIGRRVEELRPAVPVTTVVVAGGEADRQSFVTAADWRPYWVYRSAAEDDASAIVKVLETIDFGAGDGFVWMAAETAVARALRRYVIEQRHHPVAWLKASAYWTHGRAGEREPLGSEVSK